VNGYVYLIGNPVFGWYKIGKSISPEIRIKDLGILLPFKLQVVGIWQAANHHLLERTLHEVYKDRNINGEWFEFKKKEVYELFAKLPNTVRVFPAHWRPLHWDDTGDNGKFSNVEYDKKDDRRVIGVRKQKLRGNFTEHEREEKRQAHIYQQQLNKELANPSIQNYWDSFI
jgi:hypothetical protein